MTAQASPANDPSPASADALLVRLVAGERTAQAAFYRQHASAVYGLLMRMVNGRRAVADDLLQDTFLAAFAGMAQVREAGAMGAWVKRIAATQALMHLRSTRREAELFLPEADAGPNWDAAPAAHGGNGSGSDPGDPAWPADSRADDLERALAELPDATRAVVWLYHVEGHTHAEIAHLHGKTESFSKSQLSRAHAWLRKRLGPQPAVAGDNPSGPEPAAFAKSTSAYVPATAGNIR